MLREHNVHRPSVFEILDTVHTMRGTKSRFTYVRIRILLCSVFVAHKVLIRPHLQNKYSPHVLFPIRFLLLQRKTRQLQSNPQIPRVHV